MGQNSKIEWTDHTFNPWIGCTAVSPGCVNCYAEEIDRKRFSKTLGGGTKDQPIIHFGKGAPRYRTSDQNWKKPLRWNGSAGRSWQCPDCLGVTTDPEFRQVEQIYACQDCEKRMHPYRPRVFCASLADWLDDEVPIEWLADLLKLIHDTPAIDWLLLTKRPQNWKERCFESLHTWEEMRFRNAPTKWTNFSAWLSNWIGGHETPHNIWIGTTVEDQTRADQRIPELLKIPAKVRFLSCEPLLGPVEFSDVTHRSDAVSQLGKKALDGIHWLICGGESGPGARPMHPEWARSLRDQCQAAGVAYFLKQWGEFVTEMQSPEDIILPGSSWLPWSTLKEGIAKGDMTEVYKVGKKAAGRLLDGREWNEVPL